MRWQTHTLFGISSLWLLTPFLNQTNASNIGVLVFYAAFGALLPDLDAGESKIKRLAFCGVKPFVLPAVAFHRALGHRGLLHSLLGLGTFSLLAIPLARWWGWESSVALALGYASHLLADASTRGGVRLFYPQRERYYSLPTPLRLLTGSPAEDLLLLLLIAAVLLLFVTYTPFCYF
jgi:inner membrane protein